MGYALGYWAHTWEMNALRGWAVAFLTYVAATTGEKVWLPQPPWRCSWASSERG